MAIRHPPAAAARIVARRGSLISAQCLRSLSLPRLPSRHEQRRLGRLSTRE